MNQQRKEDGCIRMSERKVGISKDEPQEFSELEGVEMPWSEGQETRMECRGPREEEESSSKELGEKERWWRDKLG